MREIKFHFWHTVHKRFEDAGYMFNPEGFQARGHIVPLQCTGLKDKDNVEIYEGDIVEHWRPFMGEPMNPTGNKKVVAWQPDRPGFNIHSGRNLKVIGNIYENSELVK